MEFSFTLLLNRHLTGAEADALFESRIGASISTGSEEGKHGVIDADIAASTLEEAVARVTTVLKAVIPDIEVITTREQPA